MKMPVRLVAERGEAMQIAADEQEGAMAAVLGLDDDLVNTACARIDGDAWVANFNAPGQVVIAGSPEGVLLAGAEAKQPRGQKNYATPSRRSVPYSVYGASERSSSKSAWDSGFSRSSYPSFCKCRRNP